ncbi:MAG: glycosyltransferase family 61 protein [Firmicutes bacterium]|nr:glycosyltransferase family 61 protein [Bacillota bacterium]
MGQQQLDIYLPENYQTQDRQYFRKKTIRIPPLKIIEARQVYISENGLVMKDFPVIKPLMKESVYHYPSKYLGFVKDSRSRYRKAVKEDAIFRLEGGQNYLTIATPWSPFIIWHNYYHWLLDCVSRLIAVYDRIPNLTLLIWDFYQKWDFLMKSLLPFKDLKLMVIPNGRLAYAERLILPELRPFLYFYDRAMLEKTRDIYLNYFQASGALGPRIYITRENSERRKVVNEPEVKELLRKYDFEILDCDRAPFEKQIAVMSRADTLVSVHGAALTNMLFLPPGSKVLELHRRKMTRFDHHSKSYWYLSCSLGHRYYHQTCEPTGQYKTDFFKADFFVDIQELEKNLKRMLLT